MQIKSAGTGVTEIRDLQIQTSVSHLLIVKSGAAAITDEKITLVLKTQGGGSKSVIPLMKIRRVAVISQFGQGYQHVKDMGSSVIKSEFLLSLADAAIQLANNDYLSLDLTDLVSGSTYSVYGLESPIKGRTYNEFNTQSITGSEAQTKEFIPDESCKAIALSNNGALSSVRLSYYDGSEVTYLPTELDALMRNGNDVSFAADNLVEGDSINQTILGGGTELWYLPLNNPALGLRCRKYQVTTVGGTELALIQVIKRTF